MALADPIVGVEELSTFMRTTFTADEEDQAYMVLQVISAWARNIGGKNWGVTLPAPDDVVGVVLSASRRELNNPDRIISENMGPLSVTYNKPPDGFFTNAEMGILYTKSSGSLFTISTRREECGWGTGYLHMREDLSDDALPYLNYGEPGWGDTLHP